MQIKKEMIEAETLSLQERDEHEYWMQKALDLADKAEELGEVPIGAVIVLDGEIIGEGYNLRETEKRALAHAEIQAIEAANHHLGAWRLEGATLYVTLEPCPMCAGALINSRIERIVYGASDIKSGCVGTLMNLPMDTRFNHEAQVIRGIKATECGDKLSTFFRGLREKRKKEKVMNKTVDNQS